MKFTQLLEKYNEKNLKSLSEMFIKEEPTEEEFNKEVETAKKQHEGKIRKKISNAAVQAVEIQKEENLVNEKISDKASASEYIEDFVKSDDPKFKGDTKTQRIRRALGAYYGEHPELKKEEVEQLDELSKETLTDYKKKSLSNYKELVDKGLNSNPSDEEFKKIRRKSGNRIAGSFSAAERLGKMKNEEVESLDEAWNAQGHKSSDGERWMRKLGWVKVGGTKHPKWQHETTGETVPGWGDHGKEIRAEAARTTRNLVKDHHERHGLPYKDL